MKAARRRAATGGIVRNQAGFALPLALLGLLLISVMITGALVSSSAEVAISQAHGDAVSSLYGVESAAERYVAHKAAAAAASADSMHSVTRDPLIDGYAVSVARLFSDLDTLNGNTLRQKQTYSLLAEHASGRGRAIGVVVQSERSASLFNVSVDAGLTIGGNVSISGNSTVSDGRNAACDSAAAPNAVQVSSGATISRRGSSTIEGRADTATYAKEQMVDLLLNGLSLTEAASLATIKFAPGTFSAKARSHDGGTPRDRSNKYNWGCPAGTNCATVAGNGNNLTYYPTVSIDAGGGTVLLEGDHGQGVLIIYNGSAHIRGNFTYHGILLVEQDLRIEGTGGSSGGVKIEGAVVALGQNSTVEDNASGNAVITYNQCIISNAQQQSNVNRIANAQQTFPRAPTGWYEVVR